MTTGSLDPTLSGAVPKGSPISSENGSNRVQPSDFLDPYLEANPYPLYERLRQSDPVFWLEPFKGWLVTRYDDCVRVLKDSEAFAVDRTRRVVTANFTDPKAARIYRNFIAHHPRIRAYTQRPFFAVAMETYRRHIEEAVKDQLTALPEHGQIDFQRQIAANLPRRIVADMLGIEPCDRPTFAAWCSVLVPFFVGSSKASKIVDAETSLLEMVGFLQALVRLRRADPGEDLVSRMVSADGANPLSERELAFQLLQLVAAGYATSVDMLGSGLLTFLEQASQIERLKTEPTLVDNAVDEVLRLEPPVQIAHRLVGRDVELRGQRLKKGEVVYAVLAAANRDPEIFPEPNTFDITRPNSRSHISFGGGASYCLGASVARIEGAVLFREMFCRFPDLRLAGAPVWKGEGLIFRGLESLTIAW